MCPPSSQISIQLQPWDGHELAKWAMSPTRTLGEALGVTATLPCNERFPLYRDETKSMHNSLAVISFFGHHLRCDLAIGKTQLHHFKIQPHGCEREGCRHKLSMTRTCWRQQVTTNAESEWMLHPRCKIQLHLLGPKRAPGRKIIRAEGSRVGYKPNLLAASWQPNLGDGQQRSL